ncbi:hypothetical protein [Streptomyces graminilatus]|uniref:hypothetical protein n=1 Tax=Streptomyces graminilatus TaxID=1464070 RepID=UPI0006E1EE36|nr:hypothetical protein [Streptomyces graminilatus]
MTMLTLSPNGRRLVTALAAALTLGTCGALTGAGQTSAATGLFPYALVGSLPGGTSAVGIQVNGRDGGCHHLPSSAPVVPLTGNVVVSGGDHVVVTAYGSQNCTFGTSRGSQTYDMQSNLTPPPNDNAIEFAITSNFWQFARR